MPFLGCRDLLLMCLFLSTSQSLFMSLFYKMFTGFSCNQWEEQGNISRNWTYTVFKRNISHSFKFARTYEKKLSRTLRTLLHTFCLFFFLRICNRIILGYYTGGCPWSCVIAPDLGLLTGLSSIPPFIFHYQIGGRNV